MDFVRAILIVFLPSLSSIWLIDTIVLLINMGSSLFKPASMTYITKLIIPEKRRRFNSLRSLIDFGGFLIGPAIAGLLFMLGTPFIAIYVNAVTFLNSGIITMFLPQLKYSTVKQKRLPKLSLGIIKNDWTVVIHFSLNYSYVMILYFLFSLMIVMAVALDSLEAAFSKEVLLLSDEKYGFLVSVAGAGIATGVIVHTLMAKKITTTLLIGLGPFFVSIGYIVYAFSTHLHMAALGFVVLSFSLSFANTGFHTFYQDHIPVNVMGRVGSIYGLIEACLMIAATTTIGVAAQLFSIKSAVIAGSFFMLMITAVLCFLSFFYAKKNYDRVHSRETMRV